SYVMQRLSSESMPLAGLVLNRAHLLPEGPTERLSSKEATDAAKKLEASGEHPLAAAALRLHAERVEARNGELLRRRRWLTVHASLRVTEVPAFAEDVHDLAGLRGIGVALAGAGYHGRS